MGYFPTTITSSRKSMAAHSLARPKTHTTGARVSNLGQRFYSPDLGRWLFRDPIGERGGVGLYGMCKNDPTGHYDAKGLVPVSQCRAMARRAENPTSFTDPTIGSLVGFLKARKCAFKFLCYDKCKECEAQGLNSLSPARAGPDRADYGPGRGTCNIKLCAPYLPTYSSQNPYELSIIVALRHELAHCASFCVGHKLTDCAAVLCQEIYSVAMDQRCRINPSLYWDCIKAKARASAGTMSQCSGVDMDAILSDATFVSACHTGGWPFPAP